MKIINIQDKLSSQPEGSFIDLVNFNQHQFGVCSITGISPVWEMHPDTDEFFHILDGDALFVLLEDSGEKEYKASAGDVFVIPQGVWHKPGSVNGMKFIYLTPGKSLHSDLDDPRTSG
ncbi:MAG: cupin domain-containing protein [Acidiferrobacterales bacterium]|nr:cupin domain-containing protein [Acidiferrobacterales bacterium]